jgi:hypothetical protein
LVVSRLPEEARDWLEDSGLIFIGGSGQLGEFIKVRVPATEVKHRLVTLRVVYIAEKVMYEPLDGALHAIAHDIAHVYLNGRGDPDHESGGGYDAEVKADNLVLAWGFTVPPDRLTASEKCRPTISGEESGHADAPPQGEQGGAAEDIVIVKVRRQWNDSRPLEVSLGALRGFHWREASGGVWRRSPRPFLHARMWCSSIPDGSDFPHSCLHGPPPHAILVCICKKDNPRVFERLLPSP